MNKKFVGIVSFVAVALIVIFSYINISSDSEPENVVLSNPNASTEAKQLYEYILYLSGNATLSGQQESTWMGSADYETDYIVESSGKYPAIKGFDYMNDDFEGVNNRTVEWWNKGGIVTICWHCGSDFSGEWNDSMNSEVADWEKYLTEGTDEYNEMIEGMDKAAAALKELCDRNIPVLWRPFHEFDGNWFWWSKGGADNFKKLWKIMYDRYTDYWQLDNLVWVLGFSDQGERSKKWYPGDEYCDIIGADSYQDAENKRFYKKLYKKMTGITKAGKPICLHECGQNPTVDDLKDMPWCWFMTWHTEYLTDRNTSEELNSLYNSDYVITLDEISLSSDAIT